MGCACGCSSTEQEEVDSCEIGHDHEEDGCGCGHDHDKEMSKTTKASLIVAGVFVLLGLAAEHLFNNELLMIIFAGIAIVAGLVIVLPETIESIKAKSIDINILLIVAIIGAIYVAAYLEAAAVLFLFSVGEWLEGRAMRKSNDAIKDLAELAPDTALLVQEGGTVEVSTDQVEKGQTLALKPGMRVPLDGVITKGSSSFNDAAITGESIPVYKELGDAIYAASIALDGACEFEAQSTVKDSTLAKIAEMVQDAQKQKSERENFVQRFAKIYTPLVIVAAFLVALVPSGITALGIANLGDFDTWIYRACELLVISCPCAFVISTPVTVVSALTRSARLGVLVKGGAYFEEGKRIQAIAFDKTGTLTEGRPAVVKTLLGEGDEKTLTHIAATLETQSTHPLGAAVLDFAEQKNIAYTSSVDGLTEIAGKGIAATVEGVRYAIGSKAFIVEDLGLATACAQVAYQVEREVGTALYVAAPEEGKVLGAFIVRDAVRATTKPALSALKKVRQGLRTVMLTGDNERIAAAVATEVGVDEVHAGLLPQDKTTELNALREAYGPVAFVGDGINDAPSLAAANVGIAMGGAGSAAALSSADVVLMADDLSALPKFFSLSEKTVAILKQNVVLAIGLKVFVALLVVFGFAQMWMAVLADTGVSLLVILNGMRLMRTKI